jgi:hypothetical protein
MKINLNLIPPQKREEIAKASHFKVFLKWGSEFFIIFAIFMAMLISINYILEINLSFASGSSNESEKSNNQYAEIKKYDAEIKDMNSGVLEIEKIQKGQLRWSAFFQKLNNRVPGGIELESLATKSYSISLAGKAPARDELISFKENLEKEECFTDVNLPLSNLVSKENIAFQIDFKIKPECIR